MGVMSKNLLKVIMQEPIKKPFSINGLVEKIESGYLGPAVLPQKPKKSFSPSSLAYGAGGGGCPRFWYFKFSGEDQINDSDAYAVANMKNGTLSHTRIQEAIKKSGLSIASEIKVIHNDPPIFGFVDDLIKWLDEEVPVEIKTMREEAWQRRVETGKTPVYHLIQLLIYMRLLQKKRGILLYESKNTHALHAIPIGMTEEYEAWLDVAFDWMRDVKSAFDKSELPVKPYRSNSKVCKKCPFRDVCLSAGRGVVKIGPLVEPVSE